MYNDIEFYEAATDIAEQVVTISDPQLAITVEKWLTKLTSANSGSNELNYLKLLRIMVTNRRICRPFLIKPPGGPLMSLSRYINPSPCSDRCRNVGKSRIVGGWRLISCSRAAQTEVTIDAGEEKNSNGEDEKTDGKVEKTDGADERDIDKENNTAQSKSDKNKKNKNIKQNSIVKAEDSMHTEKTLHLAAGGGKEYVPCWALNERWSEDKEGGERNVLKRVFHPCVHFLGYHFKKYHSKSIDEAYWNLLEDDFAVPAIMEGKIIDR